MFRKLCSVSALPRLRLLAHFENGEAREYDVAALLEKWPQFEALSEDDELFRSVRVDAGGYGISWNDELDLSSDELYENGAVVDLCGRGKSRLLHGMVDSRKSLGLTQREVGAAAGIKQPVVARIERGESNPRVDTIIRLLAPMGKTLGIVDLDEDLDDLMEG